MVSQMDCQERTCWMESKAHDQSLSDQRSATRRTNREDLVVDRAAATPHSAEIGKLYNTLNESSNILRMPNPVHIWDINTRIANDPTTAWTALGTTFKTKIVLETCQIRNGQIPQYRDSLSTRLTRSDVLSCSSFHVRNE
jgi:hypothetical protein